MRISRASPIWRKTIAEHYYEIPKDQRNGKCQITVSTSFFVPKPFTPFQWAPMNTHEEFLGKAYTVNHTIKDQLNKKSIKYNWHEADVTLLEGLLARGDRKSLAGLILKAYENGALYDAWSETFHYDIWLKAMEETGISYDFYNFPYPHLRRDPALGFHPYRRHPEIPGTGMERAKQGIVTPNCRQGCSGCGGRSYGGGVCYED